MSLNIDGREIGLGKRPYIIAEMSGNHNQDLQRALALVDSAALSGADAIKLQTYTADTMTLNVSHSEFTISDSKSPWDGNNLHSLYSRAYTPWNWTQSIINRARYHNIACFSSPFDVTAVDFLESLNVPAYKIASHECIDLPLIRRVAVTGKPVIISTGMATLTEISEAVDACRQHGCKDIVLLKCTSNYPARPENINLATISHMRTLFNCEVGLSDHTMGVGTSIAASALGATVIEKHLTLSRNDGGPDASFSMEPAEFKQLVDGIDIAWRAVGGVAYGPTESELSARNRRRSIYIAEDVQSGDLLTTANIRCIRPGLGLPPKYYDIVLGRRFTSSYKKGTPLSWESVM